MANKIVEYVDGRILTPETKILLATHGRLAPEPKDFEDVYK